MIGPLDELIEVLTTLPSIGRKSAQRLALHLLERPEEEVARLAQAIIDARKKIVKCRRCFVYSETELCSICSSTTRDQSLICVVEKPPDVMSLEKAGRYRGVYHCLGGALSPLAGITPDKLHIRELGDRIANEHPAEIIIGLGGSAEAETTALYLCRVFKDSGVKITRLARGLPAGMELEFVDQITLGQALSERTEVHL
ncbi:MAG: recombination mediator RecR [Chitinispirillaceae bacterium]|jgi:recombination protein RecR|nr:recombination mediator RecR [Chitinispirillaceae bacterium]